MTKHLHRDLIVAFELGLAGSPTTAEYSSDLWEVWAVGAHLRQHYEADAEKLARVCFGGRPRRGWSVIDSNIASSAAFGVVYGGSSASPEWRVEEVIA